MIDHREYAVQAYLSYKVSFIQNIEIYQISCVCPYMGIWCLTHNSVIFCPIRIKNWYSWAKIGPNMGVAAPQAPVGSWGVHDPLKSLVMGPSLLDNFYPEFRKQVSQINQADR